MFALEKKRLEDPILVKRIAVITKKMIFKRRVFIVRCASLHHP